MSTASQLAPDAAMVLGIAATAMPFARTPADEAERWLRLLRLHGDAGVTLQALGVGEGPLPASQASPAHERYSPSGSLRGGGDRDAVAEVTEQAIAIADQRGAAGVGTTDILSAVMRVYGEDFDRVLRSHGTDRDEVLERLAVKLPGHGDSQIHTD